MTSKEIDDCFASLGRAYAEKRDLVKKVETLERRLRNYGNALVTLVDNPVHEESLATIAEVDNPIKDWKEFQEGTARLTQLNKILS